LPLSLGVGQVMVRPGLPPLNFYVSAQWIAYHQNSPIASQWSANFWGDDRLPAVQKE